MRFKLILIGIVILISALGVIFNPFCIIKKSELKKYKTDAYNDSVSVAKLSRENILKDSLLFDCRQTSDMKDVLIKEQQIVQDGINKRLQACKNKENTCCEELLHAEQNGGIIRDTIHINFWGKEKKKK